MKHQTRRKKNTMEEQNNKLLHSTLKCQESYSLNILEERETKLKIKYFLCLL